MNRVNLIMARVMLNSRIRRINMNLDESNDNASIASLRLQRLCARKQVGRIELALSAVERV